MNVDLPISGFAIAGPGAELVPQARREELPPPGTKRRGGRLPLLAAALARRSDTRPPEHVLFGTALGCLTETQLFVEHMVQAEEATPKPRAFSSSVHNAIASRVAQELSARGECQTFSHGEVSFFHAVFAAALTHRRHGAASRILVGAVDEASEYVARGLGHCSPDTTMGEGGAVLDLANETASDAAPLARISRVALGRPKDRRRFIEQQSTGASDVCLAVPALDGSLARVAGTRPLEFAALHASLGASATALAVAVLADEAPPSALGLTTAPESIDLVCVSRLGDCALVRLDRCTR